MFGKRPWFRFPLPVRQFVKESADIRCQGRPAFVIHCHIHEHIPGAHQRLPHGLDRGEDAGPVFFNPPDKVPQEKEVTYPSHLFCGPVRLVVMGAKPQGYDLVALRDQGPFR